MSMNMVFLALNTYWILTQTFLFLEAPKNLRKKKILSKKIFFFEKISCKKYISVDQQLNYEY